MKAGWKGWIFPVTVVALWQCAAWAGMHSLFFPAPSKLVATAVRLFRAGTLQTHVAVTMARTLVSFLIGSFLGVGFGLLLSLHRVLRESLRPMLSAGLTTPKVTLLPLFMLLLGLGEPARMMPAIATCFAITGLATLEAAIGIDRRYLDLAKNYGAGHWQQVRHVFLPASLPRVFTGLRTALGTCLVLTLSTEMLSAENGIGGMIWTAWQTLAIDNLLVGVLIAALLGLALQILLDKLERAVIPWSHAASVAATILLCLLIPGRLGAQTTGALEGSVLNPAGRAVAGAKLVLRDTETGFERSLTSDAQGRYSAYGLPPGTFQIEASADGFEDEVERGIEVTAGDTLRSDLHLHLGPVRQTVEVTAQTPLVSPSPSDWGQTIGQNKLAALPLNGRDMYDLAAQQPGSLIASNTRADMGLGLGIHLSVNSLRPSTNGFRIDGIYVDDATGSSPASEGGRTLAIEGTQELRLVTSPFSAEYGRAAGAILTAVSKSGGNQWHGSAYEYLRNSDLDAKNYFDPARQPIPPFRRNQFGTLLSGPLRKNRLFFLVNYEGIRQYNAHTTIATTLSDAARNGLVGGTQVSIANTVRPFLAAFPMANGLQFSDGSAQFISSNKSITPEDYVSGKLDAMLNSRWRTASRVTFDTGSTTSQDAMQTVELDGDSHYFFAHNEAQFVPSGNVVNTFRAGFSRIVNAETSAAQPHIPGGLNIVPGQSMGAIAVTGLTETGGTIYRGRPRQFADNDYQTSYQLNYVRGPHTFLAGGSFDRIESNERADQQGPGLYRFNSIALFLQGKAASIDYMTPSSDTVRGWRYSLFTGFAQDTWRITPAFQAMLGVRYEAFTVPSEVNGKIATIPNPLEDSAVTVGGPLFRNPSKLNFAPRGAIAWDVTGSGKTVFRAGAGIFYDLLGSRDLLISGVRMPPFYVRPVISNPVFPNEVALIDAGSAPLPLLSMDALTYNPQQSYVLQYQASLQHQLGSKAVATLAYAGGRGIHLLGYIGNVDMPAASIDANGLAYIPHGEQPVNPAFARIGMRDTQFDSYSHSLQSSIQRRLGSGVRVEAGYTFSKSIDDSSSPTFNDFVNSDLVPVLAYRNNRGLSNFDLRHNFTLNGSWSLPPARSAAVARFLTRWDLEGLMRLQSGFPFSPIVGFDRIGLGDSGDGAQRPNFAGAPGMNLITGDPHEWFNPAAFALQPAGYFGNLGRDALEGPGLFNLDLAAHKTLWSNEGRQVTLRVEAFNVTNHPSFQLPSGLALFNSSGGRNATAGQITSTSTASRQIQFALRAQF